MGISVPDDVLRTMMRHLHSEAWEVVEASIRDVSKVVAMIRRKRDGKLFIAELNLMGGEINLKGLGK